MTLTEPAPPSSSSYLSGYPELVAIWAIEVLVQVSRSRSDVCRDVFVLDLPKKPGGAAALPRAAAGDWAAPCAQGLLEDRDPRAGRQRDRDFPRAPGLGERTPKQNSRVAALRGF